jgi:hypothetical protein
MVWFPEVRRVAAGGDGGDVYVVGHPLVDEFLRVAGGRARPNTVRAYAHELKTFFSVVPKDPVEVRARDVFGFIHGAAGGAGRCGERGADLRWWVGAVGGDGAAAAGCGVGVLRLSGCPR